MLDYSSDIDSEIYPASGECSFWLRGESCGRTTCHECGADAAAALVANAAASLTGVVEAARKLVQDGDDPHDVMTRSRLRFLEGRCARMVLATHTGAWTWWFSGFWEAAAGMPSSDVPRAWAIAYGLGRLAFVAWRNAREENRRV